MPKVVKLEKADFEAVKSALAVANKSHQAIAEIVFKTLAIKHGKVHGIVIRPDLSICFKSSGGCGCADFDHMVCRECESGDDPFDVGV